MQEINEVNFIHYYVNTKGKNPTYLISWRKKNDRVVLLAHDEIN